MTQWWWVLVVPDYALHLVQLNKVIKLHVLQNYSLQDLIRSRLKEGLMLLWATLQKMIGDGMLTIPSKDPIGQAIKTLFITCVKKRLRRCSNQNLTACLSQELNKEKFIKELLEDNRSNVITISIRRRRGISLPNCLCSRQNRPQYVAYPFWKIFRI